MAISDITGRHVLKKNFLTVAAYAGLIVWLSGAVLLPKRTDFKYYLLSFFYGAMSIADLSHFVFPSIERNYSLRFRNVHGRTFVNSSWIWFVRSI